MKSQEPYTDNRVEMKLKFKRSLNPTIFAKSDIRKIPSLVFVELKLWFYIFYNYTTAKESIRYTAKK